MERSDSGILIASVYVETTCKEVCICLNKISRCIIADEEATGFGFFCMKNYRFYELICVPDNCFL